MIHALDLQVGLAFCTIYTFIYRTTWCVFPFTLIAMCWCKLLSQCRCSRCGVLCCKKRKTLAKLTLVQLQQPTASLIEAPAPQPVTELLQFRAQRQNTINTNSIQRESSVSTPTPSTTPEVGTTHVNATHHQQLNNGEVNEVVKPIVVSREPYRTLDDGPTTKQQILIASIWIVASIFGFLTCFPDKMIGEQFITTTELPSSDPPSNDVTEDNNFQWKLIKSTTTTTTTLSPIDEPPDSLKIGHCTIKNGVNDMLDYIALVVALVAPFIIGPCIVGVFQVRLFKAPISSTYSFVLYLIKLQWLPRFNGKRTKAEPFIQSFKVGGNGWGYGI